MMQALDRLKEPSTWAGFAVLLSVFGVHIAPEALTPLVQTATGIAGTFAVFMSEKKV